MTNFKVTNLVSIGNLIDLEPNFDLKSLIAEIERDLKIIVDWLKGSGLKVNEGKTEICLFHRHNIGKVEINLNNC